MLDDRFQGRVILVVCAALLLAAAGLGVVIARVLS